jgi:hypothetical protein
VDLTSAIVLRDKDVDGEVDAVIIGNITVEEVRKIINSINFNFIFIPIKIKIKLTFIISKIKFLSFN